MQSAQKLGAVAVARRLGRCLVVAQESCGNFTEARKSLERSGVDAEVFLVRESGRYPTTCIIDTTAQAARSFGADGIVGIGPGGTLDLAKAAGALAPLFASFEAESAPPPSIRQFLLGGSGPDGQSQTLLPGASLPVLLVPTTSTVAATSGRCLLANSVSTSEPLAPLAVAGPGPFGVGSGLQAADVLADVEMTRQQSLRGTVLGAAHALSVFVDSSAAAAGTIKEHMLREDMATGLCSVSAALRQPAAAKVDALQAALAAGVAASDADANARGGLSVVHALSCVLVGSRPRLPFGTAAAKLLPPVLRAWASEAAAESEDDAIMQSLGLLAKEVLPRDYAASTHAQGSRHVAKNCPLLLLAAFVEDCCAKADLQPGLPLAPGECLESAAALLAVQASNAPILTQRPAPAWLHEPQTLASIFRAALSGVSQC